MSSEFRNILTSITAAGMKGRWGVEGGNKHLLMPVTSAVNQDSYAVNNVTKLLAWVGGDVR